jgi:glycosyltransferase involved in cell wall biosynthesis
MARPLISIVIPARPNESVDLTMATLMRQTCQDFEMHVVVDKDLRGVGWARNRGAECARGQYLLFSDSDIIWAPDALAVMVETLERACHAESLLDAGWGRRHCPRCPDQGATWRTAYAYVAYDIVKIEKRWFGGTTQSLVRRFGDQPWDLENLKTYNFVSPMTLMLRSIFPSFDESLGRLQDWHLWLRLALEHRIKGVWVGRTLFVTPLRVGISYGGPIGYEEARMAVYRKLGLPLPGSAP